MTEILLTGTLGLNSINQHVRVVVIGLIALIFISKTTNIFANSFIKYPNPFIKNQLSIIRTCYQNMLLIFYHQFLTCQYKLFKISPL